MKKIFTFALLLSISFLSYSDFIKIGDAEDFGKIVISNLKWSEGPLFKDGKILYSEVPLNTIFSYSINEGAKVFKRPACVAFKKNDNNNYGSNGLALDNENRVVICDEGNRAISILDEKNFTLEIITNKFDNKRYNSPNDAIVAKNSTIFFTDPPYGLRGAYKSPDREMGFYGVFKIGKDGNVALIDKNLNAPNGIGLSCDNKRLYVSVSGKIDRGWFVYDLDCNMNVIEKRKFADVPKEIDAQKGSPDGFFVYKNDMIFSSAPGGICIFSKDLKPIGFIEFKNIVSNCCLATFNDTEYIFTTGNEHSYLLNMQKILDKLETLKNSQ